MKIRFKNENYSVWDDDTSLPDLVLSQTTLGPCQSTNGNSSEVDEIYVFQGDAEVIVGSETRQLKAGDYLTVAKNEFRKVSNPSSTPLPFYSIWKNE